MSIADLIPGVREARIAAGITVLLLGLLTAAYVAGKYYNMKNDLEDAQTKVAQLSTDNGVLKANQEQLLSTATANEATIKKLLADNALAATIAASVAAENDRLKGRLAAAQAAGQKGTPNDGPLSSVLRQTLESLPGATK